MRYARALSNKKDKNLKKAGEAKADIGETKVDVKISMIDMNAIPGDDASVSDERRTRKFL